MTKETYSLAEAAMLTGFSEGKFRYNRELLLSSGATVSADGWVIPHETLKELGWLGVKPPKKKQRAISRTEHERLMRENQELKQRISELESQPRGIFRRRK